MITPAYLTAADHPWLRALLDLREAFTGRTRREWCERMGEPLGAPAPRAKLRTALHVLERLSGESVASPVAPSKVRRALFRAAALEPDRETALARTAGVLGMGADAVLRVLFADLPDERVLAPLGEPLSPAELTVRANASLVAGLLYDAKRVRIKARGNVRALVRHAKLAGLLCVVAGAADQDDLTLDISGPYALFRHTRVYGRALASLVPRLAWCRDFRLEADCPLDPTGETGRLVVRSGDAIAPARELAPFDSGVEARFARDFAKLAPRWDVVREPSAIAVGPHLVFPDFELRPRIGGGAPWLVEIVGYWTPEYLDKKMARLAAARIERLILCIDEARGCARGDMPQGAHIVRYKRRVDPRTVLAIVEPDSTPAASRVSP
jgi:predicted nuclease of restriction endonuclease-like RecB superfamily